MINDVNLYIDQGVTFGCRLIVHYPDDTPVDLTGAIIRVQFRKTMTSPTVYSFTVVPESLIDGTILLTMSKTDTANLKDGRYIFDGDYEIGGNCYAFVKGTVTVYPRVTR